MSNRAVLAVGFATVIASAMSIGITEYRSSKAHQDFLQAEKRRELWEFKHCRDKEMSSVSSMTRNKASVQCYQFVCNLF